MKSKATRGKLPAKRAAAPPKRGPRRNPTENTPGRRRLHQFGNDVGFEDDQRAASVDFLRSRS